MSLAYGIDGVFLAIDVVDQYTLCRTIGIVLYDRSWTVRGLMIVIVIDMIGRIDRRWMFAVCSSNSSCMMRMKMFYHVMEIGIVHLTEIGIDHVIRSDCDGVEMTRGLDARLIFLSDWTVCALMESVRVWGSARCPYCGLVSRLVLFGVYPPYPIFDLFGNWNDRGFLMMFGIVVDLVLRRIETVMS